MPQRIRNVGAKDQPNSWDVSVGWKSIDLVGFGSTSSRNLAVFCFLNMEAFFRCFWCVFLVCQNCLVKNVENHRWVDYYTAVNKSGSDAKSIKNL